MLVRMQCPMCGTAILNAGTCHGISGTEISLLLCISYMLSCTQIVHSGTRLAARWLVLR